MSKKSARPIGEVKITRPESDDEVRACGVATWELEAGAVRAYIQRSLRDPGAIRYHVSSVRNDGATTLVVPPVIVRERDFAAAVAEAKRLMVIARDAR